MAEQKSLLPAGAKHAAQSSQTEELTGVFARIVWRSADPENTFIIGKLQDGTSIKGTCNPADLIPGLSYRFLGKAGHNSQYGPEFQFKTFIQADPHSRHGVVEYLKKFAPDVGPARAMQLCDLYGAERAIAVLKTNPAEVASRIKGLTLAKAQQAADALKAVEKWQETKIDLLDLFAGRGFPGELIERCIKRWGVKAPVRIKHDPWQLLVCKMPGCGFLRVQQLYQDLGLPMDRLKVQTICAWHFVHSESFNSGSTWHETAKVVQAVEQKVSGCVKADRAIKLGLRAKWLALKVDEAGRKWLAEWKGADDEGFVARKVGELSEAKVEVAHEVDGGVDDVSVPMPDDELVRALEGEL